MKQLSANWFIEGWVDFEYKKFTLLAYLKEVSEAFNQTHLYPAFSDIIHHYRNLCEYRDEKERFQRRFPQDLSAVDLEKFSLEYESRVKDDEQMQEIEDIVSYSIPRMKFQLEEGKEIYEFIEEKIEIDPVGVMPLSKEQGYLLMYGGLKNEVKAYEYRLSIFEQANERFRSIKTEFLTSFEWSISQTFEHMKLELVRSRRNFPNPATFSVSSQLAFPEQESFFPVAKRKFMRFLANF